MPDILNNNLNARWLIKICRIFGLTRWYFQTVQQAKCMSGRTDQWTDTFQQLCMMQI